MDNPIPTKSEPNRLACPGRNPCPGNGFHCKQQFWRIGPIFILTGPSGSGKTTACCELMALARQQGLDCAGIVCPARFQDNRKTGIDLLDVRMGERRPLAEVDNLPADLRIGPFRFDTQVMSWGIAVLNAACPCDILIVDEIGPLELERRQGWVNALEVLRAGQFGAAVAVVRPGLVEAFRSVVKRAPLHMLTVPPAGSYADLWRASVLASISPQRYEGSEN